MKKETLEEYDIKDNKIMLLQENLECVNMYLDDLKIPRTDDKGNEYSIVGRIKILQQEQNKNKYSEEEVKSAFKIGFSIGYGSDIHAIDERNRTCEEWFEQFKKK